VTIQEIYDLAVEMGISADPRGGVFVRKQLKKAKEEYKELSEKNKKFFDLESLYNPYSDSRIYVGDPKKQVKKILAGIDANATEVLLADRLNQQDRGIDLLIGHHPSGHGLAGLHDVMELQVDVLASIGMPVNVAHALMIKRMRDVALRFHPLNHNQAIDTAKLLGIPLMSLHTVWDNLGHQFMQNYLNKKTFETVGELFDYLMELPEYQEATRGKAGPLIVSGNEKSRAGKIVLFFTGGTSPSKEIYIELAKIGVGTIIDMHMKEDTIIEMRKLHINVINSGHMSSDSIGANLFFDKLELNGIEIIPCSGLIRVKRKAI
jgi:putative NIF3 family GTP cyclohydrolase 1 type 2